MLWEELNPNEEEKALIERLCEEGIGKHLSEEEINYYQVGEETSFTIETRAGACLVHYYKPIGTEEAIPLFINIHGGGFIKGRRDQDIVFCKNICSRAGCVVLDIDYVPAPVMRYPGQVYACYDVLQYCFEHSRALGIDDTLIAVGGHSAGGTLTAAIVLKAIAEGGHLPVLQILDYAGFEFVTSVYEKRNGTTNPRIPAERAEFYNKMYVEPEQRSEIFCSPGLAPDKYLAKMPPTVMVYCDNDTFCDESAAFNARLLAVGVPVYAKRFFHSSHGFTVQRKDEYETAERMILNALRLVFKGNEIE